MASRKKGPSLRRLALGPLLALAACLAILATDRQTGLAALLALSEQVARARDSVDDLARERDELSRRVRRLRGDPLAIEAAAREQLGMVRPGEIVIRWAD